VTCVLIFLWPSYARMRHTGSATGVVVVVEAAGVGVVVDVAGVALVSVFCFFFFGWDSSGTSARIKSVR
jgi:hypothetical protein